jgi:hypothetical protein
MKNNFQMLFVIATLLVAMAVTNNVQASAPFDNCVKKRDEVCGNCDNQVRTNRYIY